MPRIKRIWWLPVVVAIVLVGAYYLLAPNLALLGIRQGLEGEDREQLAAHIDFPQLRSNLKSQLYSVIDRSGRHSPYWDSDSPLTDVLVNGLVESYVRPDSLLGLMQGRQLKPANVDQGDSWREDAFDESFLDWDEEGEPSAWSSPLPAPLEPGPDAARPGTGPGPVPQGLTVKPDTGDRSASEAGLAAEPRPWPDAADSSSATMAAPAPPAEADEQPSHDWRNWSSRISAGFEGFNRYLLRVPVQQDRDIVFVLERQGWRWRLIDIQLPPEDWSGEE